MKIFDKSMVVVAGLTAALSLGMVGCSSNSATSTSAADSSAAASSTAESTSEASSSSASTATTSAESSSGEEIKLDYANSYYGVAFKTPEGFTKADKKLDSETQELMYYATDGANSEIYILGNKGVTNMEGVTDEASWGDFYGAAEKAKLEAEGETDIVVKGGSATVGEGKQLTVARIDSKKDGKAVYREILLTLDKEGDGLCFMFKTDSEETLKLMENCIGSYKA